MKKMRLLTFMQLAEANNEMSFEMIQKELQLEPDQVEAFIIDGKNDRFLVTKCSDLPSLFAASLYTS